MPKCASTNTRLQKFARNFTAIKHYPFAKYFYTMANMRCMMIEFCYLCFSFPTPLQSVPLVHGIYIFALSLVTDHFSLITFHRYSSANTALYFFSLLLRLLKGAKKTSCNIIERLDDHKRQGAFLIFNSHRTMSHDAFFTKNDAKRNKELMNKK